MLKKEQLARIYAYNQKRNLTEYSEEKELGFKIEEIDEWYKAKTPEDKVDALCDLIVFSGGVMFKNAYELIDHEPYSFVANMVRIVDHIKSERTVIKMALRMIEELGYNSTLCMDEVLKHIESREGEFNKETGKFEKYKTPEYMEKWYEQDFASCLHVREGIIS